MYRPIFQLFIFKKHKKYQCILNVVHTGRLPEPIAFMQDPYEQERPVALEIPKYLGECISYKCLKLKLNVSLEN